MKEWVIITVSVSVVSSVFSVLLTESETKKAFRLLCGAVMVITMLFPVVNLCEQLSGFDTDDISINLSESFSENSNEIMLSAVKSGYENLLMTNVFSEFSCVKNISVFIAYEDGEYILEKIVVNLNEHCETPELIEEKIRKITETDCEVLFVNEF